MTFTIVCPKCTMSLSVEAKLEALPDTARPAVPIGSLVAPVRVKNALQEISSKHNIRYLHELSKVSRREFLLLRNFGRSSLNELNYILSHYGVELR